MTSFRIPTRAVVAVLGLSITIASSHAVGQVQQAQVQQSIQHDTSIPLRDIVPVISSARHEEDDLPRIPRPNAVNLPDRVIQGSTQRLQSSQAPTAGANFMGLGTGFPGVFVNVEPPDTNMAVGPTQIVQTVNSEFVVLDKTGHVLLSPRNISTLWSGFGGGCQTNNDGDPVVLYDKFADRWYVEQFSVSTTPYLECVAVSSTNDATGAYYRYSFNYGGTQFPDYPKSGVWADGYYTTYNIFNNGQTFAGSKICAFDRTNMLLGNAATQQCFLTSANYGGLLPADIDGFTLPPTGTPNYVLGLDVTNTSLAFWKFHVDWTTPGNTTLTGPTSIPIASYSTLCNANRSCIPQPGATTSQRLDGIDDRSMYRLAYRNYGSYDALYTNHTVQAGSSTGVRWYEIRNLTSTTPTVFQQGTFAPDAKYRWMGSIASDQQGNLALGYSHASSVDYPGIRYTGRLASDPAGTMQPESILFTGGGSQLDSYNRWGDYSSMSVDPSDDCTFWFTTEYYATNGSFGWSTRIGSFKFPTCSSNPTPDLTIAKAHTGNFTQGQSGATYSITVSNAGSAATSGPVNVTDTLPAGLTATAISGTGWTCTTSPLSCTRSDVLAASTSYPAITVTVDVATTAPSSVTNTATVSGGGETNTANDTANDVTTVAGNGTPDLTITSSHTGNFTQGQTGATYTISVTNSGAGPTNGTVNVSDALPTGLTATAISGTGWSCTLSTLSCSRTDSLINGGSYPAITLTVTVSTTAPTSLTNTATVSGGGEANTANDTATDPTTIIVAGSPDTYLTMTHVGNFTQGQVGAQYSINVSNVGTAATSGGVYLWDTMPTGLTATAISGSGWTCNVSRPSCSRSDSLAPGASWPTITLTVNVSSTAPSSVTNFASISGGGDTTGGNDGAKDVTIITAGGSAPDLTVAKSHVGNFTQGQTGATYTITVKNSGTAATTGTVTATDTLPAGLTAAAISGTGWTCTISPLGCNRSDVLAASASYPAITVTVNVSNTAPASLTNSVSVSGGGETNTANDSASDPTTITAPPVSDLTVASSHVGSFTQGQTGATYTITVANSGTAATTGTVTATDTLPAGLTATAISGTGWTCTLSPLSCSRSDVLAASSSYPAITLTVNVSNTAPTSVANSVVVSGGGETNTANDSATDLTTINALPLADLTVTSSHVGNFTQGQTGATYTITVKNSGTGATAGAVNVSDTLPSGLTAASISGTGWSCSISPLSCTRSDALAANSSYPAITISVNVATSAPSSVMNSATVSGGGETNTANDTATDPTTIIGAGSPDTYLTMTHVGNFTQGQVGAQYSINVSNVGTVATSGGVYLADTMPIGLTATAMSGSGWTCNVSRVSCSRSDSLAPGASWPTITLTVNVSSTAPSSVTNFASISGGGDTTGGNNGSKDPTIIQ